MRTADSRLQYNQGHGGTRGMPSFLSLLMLLSCLGTALLPSAPLYCAEPLKIGVLAFRPKAQTLEQWKPLAAALKQVMPKHDFVVEALTYPEMNIAVANRQVDFVFTNPGHFVLLKMRGRLSAPLATLALDVNGQRTSVFGGVIISRTKQTNILTLRDLKGKIIAVPDTESLGGYQMQAYELNRVGVRLPKDAKLVITGMPHDNVVKAVLDGRADAGFVRSGVLEDTAREGKLDLSLLKILNRQTYPDFPLQVSTRLYPEWPLSALSHTDRNLARHVAAALFTFEENNAFMHAMHIRGFSVPADYVQVEEVLRELRFPPYDAVPSFTLQDVWERYRMQVAGALIAAGLIFVLIMVLLALNRKLMAERRIVQSKQRALQQSEKRFKELFDEAPLGIALIDSQTGHIDELNQMFAEIAGRTKEELLQIDWMTITHPDDLQHNLDKMAPLNAGEIDGFHMEKRCLQKDGTVVWINMTVARMHGEDDPHPHHLCMVEDITERRKAEEEREAALARVSILEGIIPICTYCKKIRDDQQSWHQLEAYISSHSEAKFSHGVCPDCFEKETKELDV